MPANYYRSKDLFSRVTDSRNGSYNLLGPYSTELEYRTFSGTRTVGYRNLLKTQGYVPTLPCDDIKFYAKAVPRRTNVLIYDYPSNWTAVYDMLSVGNVDLPPFNGMDDELIDQAWSALRQEIIDKDFDAGEFTAELGQTAKLITSTATTIYKSIRAMRRGNLGEVIDTLGITKPKRQHRDKNAFRPIPKGREQDLHNRWLEFKYGWGPLLSDVHGAATALAKRAIGVKSFRRISKTKSRSVGYKTSTAEGRVRYKATVWAIVRTRNPNLALLDSLGLLNPVYLAWQLTPFSFVFDWFVNVGDFLQEATAFSNVTVLDGGQGLNMDYSGTHVTEYFGSGPGSVKSEAYVRVNQYARRPGVQTLPVLRMEPLSKALTFQRVVTSVALLKQRLQ